MIFRTTNHILLCLQLENTTPCETVRHLNPGPMDLALSRRRRRRRRGEQPPVRHLERWTSGSGVPSVVVIVIQVVVVVRLTSSIVIAVVIVVVVAFVILAVPSWFLLSCPCRFTAFSMSFDAFGVFPPSFCGFPGHVISPLYTSIVASNFSCVLPVSSLVTQFVCVVSPLGVSYFDPACPIGSWSHTVKLVGRSYPKFDWGVSCTGTVRQSVCC